LGSEGKTYFSESVSEGEQGKKETNQKNPEGPTDKGAGGVPPFTPIGR